MHQMCTGSHYIDESPYAMKIKTVLLMYGIKTMTNYILMWKDATVWVQITPDDLKNLFHQEEKIKEDFAAKTAEKLTAN